MMKKQVLLQAGVFLGLTFTISLVCALLMYRPPFYRYDAAVLILYGIEAMSPALSAILTKMIFERRSGVLSFLKKSYTEHINLKTVCLAVALPFIAIVPSKLIYCLVEGIPFSVHAHEPIIILAVFWALIAEELGWRGFLQEQLGKLMHPLAIPLLTGVIWAVWHFHFFLYESVEIPIAVFVIGCIIESYIYYYLTKRSRGNVIPASVFHFSGNLCINLFMIYPESNNGSLLPSVLHLVFFGIIALIMIRRPEFSQHNSMQKKAAS